MQSEAIGAQESILRVGQRFGLGYLSWRANTHELDRDEMTLHET